MIYCTAAVASETQTVWRGLQYGEVLAEVRTGGSNKVEFRQVADTPLTYSAWGVWSFPYTVREAAVVALDFDRYTEVFRHVYRCERVRGPYRSLSPLGTWYVEGRASVARVWAVGNVDVISWATVDSSEMRLFASQNRDSLIEKRYREVLGGWINLRTYGLRVAAFVAQRGDDSCRVGIVVQGIVSKPMPVWLVNLAIKVVMPVLLTDFGREIERFRKANARGKPVRSH